VLVLGDDLTNFILRSDVLAALREELQAEIDFGRRESLGRPVGDVDDNIAVFLAQGDDWFAVESDIVADRDTRERKDPPATQEFAQAAPFEVAAIQEWWDGDLSAALEHGGAAISALGKNPQARRYAALWNYLASSWTRMVAVSADPTDTLRKAADAYLLSAREGGRGTTWLSNLAHTPDAMAAADQYDDLDRLAANQVLERVLTWSRKDDTALETTKVNLAQTKFKRYEAGLTELGRFAGATATFDSGNAQAAPDSVWIFGEQIWVAWEAKSEAGPAGAVATRHAREASGHLRYVKAQRGSEPPIGSFTVFATPQAKVDHAAKAVCGDEVYRVDIHEPAMLLAALDRSFAKIRALGPGADEAGALAALNAEDCLPSQWIVRLTRQQLMTVGEEAAPSGSA
jgi:hypothetical protein